MNHYLDDGELSAELLEQFPVWQGESAAGKSQKESLSSYVDERNEYHHQNWSNDDYARWQFDFCMIVLVAYLILIFGMLEAFQWF